MAGCLLGIKWETLEHAFPYGGVESQCKREAKTKPSEMCPCTTVHELVGEIKGKVNL